MKYATSRASAAILSVKRLLAGFARDRRGVSAVEFALLLPLMLSIYLGSIEVSQGISAQRKVTLTARSIADLVAQVSSINNADMTNSLNAAAAVMAPFSTDKLSVKISSIAIDGAGKATIAWSDALNGSGRTKGSSVTLPAALVIPNSSLIWSEVQYSYKPTLGYMLTGTLALKDQIYMRPRLSDSVTRINS